MNKNEVKVGQFYRCVVCGNMATVKITGISSHGGWEAINQKTNRKLRIKSAHRLKGMAKDPSREIFCEKKKSVASKLDAKLVSTEETKTLSHLIVVALAGTGKTFTMIVGVAWMFFVKAGLWTKFNKQFAIEENKRKGTQVLDPDTFRIHPSEEQKNVWERLAESDKATTVTYCAFNKTIVNEFGEHWGWMVGMLREVGVNLQFATVNSLGNRACSAAFGRLKIERDHVQNLLEVVSDTDIWELRKKEHEAMKATERLVNLCKLTLVGWTKGKEFSPDDVTEDELDVLTNHYDIELNGNRDKVYAWTRGVLGESLKVDKYREIDFNDQNWLPVVLNLPISKIDLLIVDEGQDLPRCKQEFVIMTATRLSVVGDTNQAIYGFAGADVDSIPRMQRLLGETDLEPVKPLILTETRRCAKKVVDRANATLLRCYQHRDEKPLTFTAHESNDEGEVRHITVDKFLEEVRDGDMVVCRVNAPPISLALQLIKKGRKAVIRGRDFGKSLTNFISEMKATDIGDLVEKVDVWYHHECKKEARKKNPNESKLISLEDRKVCIEAFCENATSVNEVKSNLALVFAGKVCPKCQKHFDEELDRCPCKVCKTEYVTGSSWPVGPRLVTPKGVMFSSIHRGKGLEAERVYILWKDAPMPHPMAKTKWQYGQELHCLYIAESRAIKELVDVI